MKGKLKVWLILVLRDIPTSLAPLFFTAFRAYLQEPGALLVLSLVFQQFSALHTSPLYSTARFHPPPHNSSVEKGTSGFVLVSFSEEHSSLLVQRMCMPAPLLLHQRGSHWTFSVLTASPAVGAGFIIPSSAVWGHYWTTKSLKVLPKTVWDFVKHNRIITSTSLTALPTLCYARAEGRGRRRFAGRQQGGCSRGKQVFLASDHSFSHRTHFDLSFTGVRASPVSDLVGIKAWSQLL